MEDIVVFIEKFDREIGYLLLDFPPVKNDIDFHSRFINRNGLSFSDSGTSMLEITNIKIESQHLPIEGRYYQLPKELMNQEIWARAAPDDEMDQTSYLSFRANGSKLEPLKFDSALHNDNHSLFVENSDKFDTSFINDSINNLDFSGYLDNLNIPIELLIHNVGYGNFNVIKYTPELFIIYDLGSRNSATIRRSIKSFFDIRHLRDLKLAKIKDNKYQRGRLLIISHWDIDHYNGLLDLSDSNLDIIDHIIIPNKLPTKTSQRAYDRLNQERVLPITMRRRTSKRGEANKLESVFSKNGLKIYRGSKSCNRNNSGLTLSVHTENHDAILPADHSYDQMDKYLVPNCISSDLFLVIPHHGGHAGNYSLLKGWRTLNEVAISVGNNPWNHPYSVLLNLLPTIIVPGNIKRTDNHGCITKTL